MKKSKRPRALSIIGGLAFMTVIISFPSIFSPLVKNKGAWYPALLGGLIAGEFIALVGVWYMKKWGPFLFLICTLLNQSTHLLLDDWSAISLIMPILLLSVSAYFYSEMDENL